MDLKSTELNVAVAVGSFLPHSQNWIYRQIKDDQVAPSVILCRRRENVACFPFEPCVISRNELPIIQKFKYKTWWLWKYTAPKLSKRNRDDFNVALEKYRINLVHAYFGTVGSLFLNLCREKRIPLVVTFLGFDITTALARRPGYQRKLIQLFNECPLLIANCHEMAKRLQQLGCHPSKIRVSYFGVSLNDFSFIDRRYSGRPVRFLHAGRLTAKKGVPDLIKAFTMAFPKPANVALDIVGGGEEAQKVKDTIEKMNPVNHINLVGECPIHKVRKYYNNADIFVLNSRTDHLGNKEGLPNSILEAGATGLPVISTFHAGIPEAVTDGKTGFLVPEYHTEALAGAMLKMTDKKLCLEMGQAARQLIEQKFELSRCNKKLRHIYEEALTINNRITRTVQ